MPGSCPPLSLVRLTLLAAEPVRGIFLGYSQGTCNKLRRERPVLQRKLSPQCFSAVNRRQRRFDDESETSIFRIPGNQIPQII